ncbi:copper chaperone PCu(A)C [Actinomadura madurae]|uniref:copper chaperone PCu(A)C n=1 Tax=Actinomadura madurae TaxID=1993 RepID=UPI0020D25A0B|nr:copper chaperone PCu(A)C [Actinomadura madurae]MCP9968143.1 copper chaperone PCu(A)C [Actinomadura madurae]MCP9980603.1 copper chaperone PCu(A)C [Actinomadura madurae]
MRIGPKPTIVLRGLKQAVQSGQFVPITFRFERSGSGSLNVPVQAREGDLESYSPAP